MSAFDLIWVSVVIFAFAIILLVVVTMNTSINSAIQSNGFLNTTPAANISASVQSQVATSWNAGFPWIFIGMNIATIILSFLVRVNPIFFVFAILSFSIMIVLTAIESNTYTLLANSDPLITASANAMPLVGWVMDNIIIMMVIFGIIDLIVLYTSFTAPQTGSEFQGG